MRFEASGNRETREKGNLMNWKRLFVAAVLAFSLIPEIALAGA